MKKNDKSADKQLLQRLRNPKEKRAAFSELVANFSKPLYWQARRIVKNHQDADDMVQNAFMKAWMAIDSFRGESQLSTWLFQIVTYESLGLLRKDKNDRELRIDVDDDNSYLLDNAEASPSVDGKDIEKKLKAAIDQLPDKQKLVFKLRYYEEMPYSKMSELTETSEGALKASYHHAVKKIEEFVLTDD